MPRTRRSLAAANAKQPVPPPPEPVKRTYRTRRSIKKEIIEEKNDEDYEQPEEDAVEDKEEDYVMEESEEEDDDEPVTYDSDMEQKTTRSKRKRITMASGGEIPENHSRFRVSSDKKRFKFRTSACTNSKVTPFNIQEYFVSTRSARDIFYALMAENGCIDKLLTSDEAVFNASFSDDENLTKWLDRSSLKLAFQSKYIARKKHTLAFPDLPPRTLKAEKCIPIFESDSFDFVIGKPKRDMTSFLVDAMLKSPKLIANKKVFESLEDVAKAEQSRKQKIQAMFCGGPILAIKPAPACASDGYQVVAISTIADEITWEQPPETPTYVQFWKFSGLPTLEKPFLWFLLKIENVGTISDMSWCPYFHDKVASQTKEDYGILGYLAIASDVGKTLIFKINKEIVNLPTENPPVVVSTPIFAFEHPTVTVGNPNKFENMNEFFGITNEFDDSELEPSGIMEPTAPSSPQKRVTRSNKKQQENEVAEEEEESAECEILDDDDEEEDVDMENENGTPSRKSKSRKKVKDVKQVESENTEVHESQLICIDWSPFSKCKDIVAVSSTGWIFLYDLEEDGNEVTDALYDISWDSPAASAKWVDDDTIAIGFQSKLIIYYNVLTKERVFQDDTPRSVGSMVAAQSVLFPGAFSYDAVRVIPDDNQAHYQCGVYQVIHKESQTGLVVPLPNKHLGQVFNLSVCETSGIIGTVGLDGRFLESINGHVICRGEENNFACYTYRPTLQLVRHKFIKEQQEADSEVSLEAEETKPDMPDAVAPPIISHDQVISNNWLEIRVGDAALIDQEPGTKGLSTAYVDKIMFHRRMESLSRVEYSKITPGLALTGGEAGIVFILSTSL